MTPAVWGRAEIIASLEGTLRAGHTVLLFGPVGVGKTAVLEAIAARARAQGVPCGISERTTAVSDLTRALSSAYPSVDAQCARTQRALRARLRIAAEAQPGLLLLDHLDVAGSAFKGVVRSFRGLGMGVLVVADIDHPRDHERVRRLRLTHREVELPPLHGQTMRGLVRDLVARVHLPLPLSPDDTSAVVAATAGLPGRAVWIVEALLAPTAWRNGRPRADWLRTEALIAATESYRRR